MYFFEDKEKIIKRIIIGLVENIIQQKDVNNKNIERIILNSGYLYAVTACTYLKKFSKNTSFIDEDEVRLYHDSSSIKGTLRLMKLMESSMPSELHKQLTVMILYRGYI